MKKFRGSFPIMYNNDTKFNINENKGCETV